MPPGLLEPKMTNGFHFRCGLKIKKSAPLGKKWGRYAQIICRIKPNDVLQRVNSNRSHFLLALAASLLLWPARDARAVINASLQMQLGNPSGATADTNNHDHFLVQRAVEALDYSDHLGEPVWASWDLTAADVGSASRSSSYFTDTNLPSDFYHVTTTDYNGVGNIDFNRGHLCPSEDRTDNLQDNDAVFFMSNIMPQSGPNNQGVWANFESFCRALAQTNELLITCGPSGFGTSKLPSGRAYMPSNTWKIVVVVPLGNGTALSRLTASNRVISISVPNVTNGLSSSWQTYLTSAHRIELDTGFTFFSAAPNVLSAAYRAKVDGSPTPAISGFQPTNGSPGTVVTITGQNLASASAVFFNGQSATVTGNTATQVTAVVPGTATSGPLSLITPGGLATSLGVYSVIKPAPALGISISSTNSLLLSWPTGDGSYVLQQNDAPEETGWLDVTNAVNVVGSLNAVVISPLPQTHFFRLRSQ